MSLGVVCFLLGSAIVLGLVFAMVGSFLLAYAVAKHYLED